MTFIHPLLLGGLLLVGIPVLIHLIMQQKPKHLLFPAFRFLLQRHRTNQRKLRLRHLLLLALRMLLIALFCLALARPRLFSERIGLGSDRPVAAVLLFDTRFSMGYEVNQRSRLQEAKDRAQELLDGLPEGSRVAVLDSGEPGGDWLLTLSQARDRVAGLRLRPNGGPVTRQIAHAYRLFDELEPEQEPGAEPLPRFLYVFSDRALAGWDANDVKHVKQPEGTNAVFVDVGVKDPQDVAITKVELPKQTVGPGDQVEVRVTAQATGFSPVAELVFQLDDETEEERKEVKLQAGQSQVAVFQRPAKGLAPGPHQVRLRLKSSDALPFNNVAHASFDARAGRSVLVLEDARGQAAIWSAALELRGFTCDVLPAAKASHFAPADLLAKYQAVCLLGVADPEGGPNRGLWDRLGGYVQKGGGLAVIPGGDEVNRDAYQSKAARNVLPGELKEIVRTGDKPDVPWNEGDSSHALMVPFREWRKTANVDFLQPQNRPAADRYWEVAPHPAEADVVVSYADDKRRPALLERKVGQGRVLLFTVPLDRRAEEWHNYWKSSFGLVLADLTTGYLAGDAEAVNFNYLSGQPATLPLPAAPHFATYTLLGPGISGAEATVKREKGQNSVQVPQAVTPGGYTLLDGKGVKVARFSVNVRPEESQVADRVPVEQVEALLGPGAVLPVGHGTGLREALQGRWLQPLELLPWMMIFLLLVLAVENLLANRFYRQPAPEEDKQTGSPPDPESARVA